MNTILEQYLAKVGEKVLTVADKGMELAAEQVPDYIQQLLMWYGIRQFIVFVVSIAFMIGVVVAAYKWVKWIRTDGFDEEGEFKYILYTIFWLTEAFVFVVAISNINLEWLQIWLAPKVWLIEYAGKLIGK